MGKANLPSFVSEAYMSKSKSLPSPSRAMFMISRFTSNTDKLVPSKLICEGSFWDLKRKKIEEDMIANCDGPVLSHEPEYLNGRWA